MNDSRSTCCRGCEKRHEGCHGSCGDYAAMKAESERIKTARNTEYEPVKVLHAGYYRRAREYRRKK